MKGLIFESGLFLYTDLQYLKNQRINWEKATENVMI